jgi:hypothetical protein
LVNFPAGSGGQDDSFPAQGFWLQAVGFNKARSLEPRALGLEPNVIIDSARRRQTILGNPATTPSVK